MQWMHQPTTSELVNKRKEYIEKLICPNSKCTRSRSNAIIFYFSIFALPDFPAIFRRKIRKITGPRHHYIYMICVWNIKLFQWALIVHVINIYIMDLYMYCSFLNGMKWRCSSFEQHKRFTEWASEITSQIICRLCKIRIWSQLSSISAKTFTKI